MSTATCSRASTIPAVIGLPRWYLETKWKQSATRQLAASCQPQKGSANQHVDGGQGRNRTTDTRIFRLRTPLIRRVIISQCHIIQALSGNQGKLAEARGSSKTPVCGPDLVQLWPNDRCRSATQAAR